MNNAMNLKTIKWESVKSIFNAIAGKEQVSRAQVSAETNLSLVTVGKVADALLNMNIITQEKQIRGSAGRRAGLLSINTEKFVLILDLSCPVFRFSVLNLGLGLIEKNRYSCQRDRFLDENIQQFFKDTSLHMNRAYNMDNCFGIGISLPGPYNPETDTTDTNVSGEFRNIHIRAMAEKYFPGYPILLDACANVAALSNISAVPDHSHKSILYWFIGEENTTGSLMVNGSFIRGSTMQPCSFGSMVLPGGGTLDNALHRCQTLEELVSVISYPLHTVIQLIAPHAIILECEGMKHERERAVAMIRQSLHEKYGYRLDLLPDILVTHCIFRHSHRGLAIRLREMWIDQVVLKD